MAWFILFVNKLTVDATFSFFFFQGSASVKDENYMD